METPLYLSEAFTRVQAWIDLLLLANYESNTLYVRGNKVEIKRGQVAKSQDTLADRWKWSRGKVLRFLAELEKEGQIVQQKSKLINIISIVNYEQYQGYSTTERTSENGGTTEMGISDHFGSTTDSTTEPIDNKHNTLSGAEQTVQQKVHQTVQQTGQPSKEYKNINNIIDIKQERGSSPTPPSASDEAKASKPKNDVLPAKEIKDMWNDLCPGFPKLVVISENRRNKMRLRIAEMGGVEKAMPLLKTIFGKMQASPFLKGDNKRGWKASFDWLFENDKNWVKVYEGNYDANTPAPSTPNRYKPKNDVNDLWNE